MKQLDKFKAEIKENLKNSTGKKKLLLTFTEKNFKKKRSKISVGVSDLTPSALEIYYHLLTKYKSKMVVELVSITPIELKLYLK